MRVNKVTTTTSSLDCRLPSRYLHLFIGITLLIILSNWSTICLTKSTSTTTTTTAKAINHLKKMDSLDNLVKENVVPDVIDAKPLASLKVEWPTSGVVAQQGNELKPTQVKEQPQISWDAKGDKLYLLAMVDPDAPSRSDPKLREIAHFMIANIPGHDIAKGDTLFEYIGAGAPQGTGLHRYIFLVYEQKARVTSSIKTPKTSRKDRVNFSIRKFAKENDLGPLIGANFFQAQYDDYVPLLHAQLSQG